MIEITRPTTQTQLFEERSNIKKAFIFNTKWVPLEPDDLFKLTLADIWEGHVRFILEMNLDGVKVFLVTCEADEAAVRFKHPEAAILNTKQFIGLARKTSEEIKNMTSEHWFKIMQVLTVFPQSKVVK